MAATKKSIQLSLDRHNRIMLEAIQNGDSIVAQVMAQLACHCVFLLRPELREHPYDMLVQDIRGWVARN